MQHAGIFHVRTDLVLLNTNEGPWEHPTAVDMNWEKKMVQPTTEDPETGHLQPEPATIETSMQTSVEPMVSCCFIF